MAIEDLTSDQATALSDSRDPLSGILYVHPSTRPYWVWLVNTLYTLSREVVADYMAFPSDAGDTKVFLLPGRATIGSTVLAYAGGTVDLATYNNQTAYLWLYNNSGSAAIGVAASGSGWPGTAHIKLAEVTLSSGVIASILDRRHEVMLTDSTGGSGGVTSVGGHTGVVTLADLSLVVGTDIQAHSAKLDSIADLADGAGWLHSNGSGVYTWSAPSASDITDLGTAAILNAGTSSGNVPVLDGTGKISTAVLPSSVLGDVAYQGTWDASGNSPTIPAASSANKGFYYVVSVAGSTSIGGITDWKIGDWLVSNGSTWDKIDNTDLVTSVQGRVGAVVITASDVGLGSVENTALSTWGGTSNIITLGTITTGTWHGSAIDVAHGGTGATTFSAHGILLGEGTGAITPTAAMTDGQLLVGQTGADPLPKTVSGHSTLTAGGAMTNVPSVLAGVPLTSAKWKSGTFAPGSGDQDYGTVPLGKRWAILSFSVFNGSGGSVSIYPQIKVSSTYYQVAQSNTIANNGVVATDSVTNLPGIILEPGEVLSVHTGGSGLAVFFGILEYDSSCPLKTAKLLSLSSGNNTIYTAPAGNGVILLDQGLVSSPVGFGTVSSLTQRIFYVNNSGGTRTYSFNVVPSGGSVGTTNQLAVATTLANTGKGGVNGCVSLAPGDFVNINVDAATATQIAWVNVVEF